MNKWNTFKVMGLAGAVVLIVFGSVGNLARTIKFGFVRIGQK
jgi:hypothetical protein